MIAPYYIDLSLKYLKVHPLAFFAIAMLFSGYLSTKFDLIGSTSPGKCVNED